MVIWQVAAKGIALAATGVPSVALLWDSLQALPGQVAPTTGIGSGTYQAVIVALWGVITAGFGLLWKEKSNYASRLETQIERNESKKEDQLTRMVDGVTKLAESQNRMVDALDRIERRVEGLPRARAS